MIPGSPQSGILASGSSEMQRLLAALCRNGCRLDTDLLHPSPVTVAGPLRILTAFLRPLKLSQGILSSYARSRGRKKSRLAKAGSHIAPRGIEPLFKD